MARMTVAVRYSVLVEEDRLWFPGCRNRCLRKCHFLTLDYSTGFTAKHSVDSDLGRAAVTFDLQFSAMAELPALLEAFQSGTEPMRDVHPIVET